MKRIIGGDFNDTVTLLEKENREIAYEAAVESMVLLKNDGSLPFEGKEVALFGSGACFTYKGGTGSGETNNRHSVSIYEGLKEAGFTLSSEAYLEEYRKLEEKSHAQWIRDHTGIPSADVIAVNYTLPSFRVISSSDFSQSDRKMAIYVVSRQSGEGADKKISNSDFHLTPNEVHDIFVLKEAFEHLTVVINSGSSMDLSEIDEVNCALIFYGQAGQEGGRAFVDLFAGKHNFSGKLSTTWVRKYADIPFGNEFSYLNNDPDNEYYKEGIYVGYRYFDSFGVSPRFHFGYGLSYSRFDMHLSEAKLEGRTVTLCVNVKNLAPRAGREVVQIYASLPKGKLDKEYQRLVAFQKTKELRLNEEEEVKLSFDIREFASFSEDELAFILEKGNYILRLGNASDNTQAVATVRLEEDVVLSRHDHIHRTTEDMNQLHNTKEAEQEDLSGLPQMVLDPSCIKTETYTYGKPPVYSDERVDAILHQLSDEEMADLCTGVGTLGMMDTNAFCTPGIAGKTTYKLLKKGLISVNLADGPTGLRLVRKTAVGKNGRIRMFPKYYLLSFMETLPQWMLLLLRPRKGDTVFYQNATAFPVGTNLAQSWNPELLGKVGRAVSLEMEKFHITYWLAPGMNIQRNPLCGRNFEYYSEDPLLSGKISAGMTRGVQSIEGNYTTIKHFACNNTEDRRVYSNSHVSERALREIYLRGFEINIKEAHSKAIMTSYNKINGTYTPDSYDLNTKVLRNEWGFNGIVMTDWYSTKAGQGHTDEAIASGNDLIMPGDRVYEKEILNGLKRGTLTREDLRRASANIIRSILSSSVAKKYSPKDFLDEE